MEPFSYEVYFDTDLAKEFQEYSRATQQLEELESLQAQLMTSVQTMDSIWLSPPQLQEVGLYKWQREAQSSPAAQLQDPCAPIDPALCCVLTFWCAWFLWALAEHRDT